MPAKGQFNVLLLGKTKTALVRVYRMDGTQVGREELLLPGVSKQFNIPVAGTYIIEGTDNKTGEVIFANKVVIL